MDQLDLAQLPDLPQKQRLVRVVHELWQTPDVIALWLGGSLARGAGDAYSDVDLRVAWAPAAFDPQQIVAHAPSLHHAAVAVQLLPFGAHATLFHMLLDDGEVYDLFVQSTEHALTHEQRSVLACRDAAFGAKLAQGADPAAHFDRASGDVIQRVIVNFWLGQHKHQKSLARGLPLMSWVGEHVLQQDLLRLWYVAATGNDCGPIGRMTIHTLSPVVRTVQNEIGTDALALLGRPCRTQAELVATIAHVRAEVSRVGRRLAQQIGFAYPQAAETTVQRAWQQFVASAVEPSRD